MPVDEAMAYLTSFPGVGHKTASIVLLFIFNMPAFPVDTHIQRISQRTGISSRRATPEKVKADWEALLPGETYFPLHISLITHGRDRCRARKPNCDGCVLLSLCDYGNWCGGVGDLSPSINSRLSDSDDRDMRRRIYGPPTRDFSLRSK